MQNTYSQLTQISNEEQGYNSDWEKSVNSNENLNKEQTQESFSQIEFVLKVPFQMKEMMKEYYYKSLKKDFNKFELIK